MAFWKENVGRMAHNAVAKSKEMAEITRLNLEISSQEQKIKELYTSAGEYLLNNPQLVDAQDETFLQKRESLAQLQEKIEQSRQALLDVRGISLCPGCGAEVNRSSRFCDRCGAEMPCVPVENEQAKPACPGCGAEVDGGAAFCPACGAKLNAEQPAQAPQEAAAEQEEAAAAPEETAAEQEETTAVTE